jgi:dsDNA-specific endonuclease/ATPase MutS2
LIVKHIQQHYQTNKEGWQAAVQHQQSSESEQVERLCNGEAVQDTVALLLGALEPALVTCLDLEEVQVAVADGGLDQLVAAALVTVTCRYRWM